MSAFTDADDLARAVRLIRLRALEPPAIKGPAEQVIAETATESDPEQKFAGLLHGVLEIFATIRPLLRPPTGPLASLVDVALAELAEHDENKDHRLAADLIVSHQWSGVDAEFRDQGADDFNRAIDRMDGSDRCYQTVVALADVWLGLLPELKTEVGMGMLEEHAKGLD
jgi:hypothetical protein